MIRSPTPTVSVTINVDKAMQSIRTMPRCAVALTDLLGDRSVLRRPTDVLHWQGLPGPAAVQIAALAPVRRSLDSAMKPRTDCINVRLGLCLCWACSAGFCQQRYEANV